MANRILALLLISSAAHAACPNPVPPQSACLTWGAVTTYTDGTPIAAPVSYRIYRDGALLQSTAQLEMLLNLEPTGLRSYQVSAVVGSSESALSSVRQKFIRIPPPTDGSIEPRR